jgi:hypothetical protein
MKLFSFSFASAAGAPPVSAAAVAPTSSVSSVAVTGW